MCAMGEGERGRVPVCFKLARMMLQLDTLPPSLSLINTANLHCTTHYSLPPNPPPPNHTQPHPPPTHTLGSSLLMPTWHS